MFEKFYLSRPCVKQEINRLEQILADAQPEFSKFRSIIEQQVTAIKALTKQIENYKAGALELQQELKQLSLDKLELSNKIKGLEAMIQEQEHIINEPTDNNQVNNLKAKIKELQTQAEELKQLNFQKNQRINQLQAN